MKPKDGKAGALLLVEDNKADQELVKQAFLTLGISNKIDIVEDGEAALIYLRSIPLQPMLILCDMNMPKMDGLQLRAEIYADNILRKKSIPFIFMSSSATDKEIELAYEYAVQGYFEKAKGFDEAVELLKLIIEYWKKCHHPNNSFHLLEESKKNNFWT